MGDGSAMIGLHWVRPGHSSHSATRGCYLMTSSCEALLLEEMLKPKMISFGRSEVQNILKPTPSQAKVAHPSRFSRLPREAK